MRQAPDSTVLMVSSSVPPQVGGIASMANVVCATLLKLRDRPALHILCRPGTGAGLADIVHDRLIWPRWGVTTVPIQRRNAAFFAELVRRHRYDLVIFLDAAARLYGLRGTPQTETAVYVHGHELLLPSPAGELLSRQLTLQIRALRRAQRVLVNSRASGELMRRRVPDVQYRVLYPCYDPARIYDPARHAASPYREPPGTFVLLTVSRLVERKGHDRVMRLLARIDAQMPPYRYYIVGDGRHRPVLEELARQLGLTERVVFAGRVPTEELGAYYPPARGSRASGLPTWKRACQAPPRSAACTTAPARPCIMTSPGGP
jgi:glycosyltransferase involved in cell wall biosynthesis